MAKRILDLLLASTGGIVLFPVFVIIALWIKRDSAGPILFRQNRIGLGGVPFQIFKFRTMEVNAEDEGTLTIGNDSRITQAGRFLRRHKLDELPQLFNVIRGEMSLVGPRPEVKKYFELYPPAAQLAMIGLRPGITGPYVAVLFDEARFLDGSVDPHLAYTSELVLTKARYIMEYAAHHSVLGDIKIILCTLRKLVSGGH